MFYITFVNSKNNFQMSLISHGSDNRKWRFSAKRDKSVVHICIASKHYGYLSPVWLEIWSFLLWKFVHNKNIFRMSLISPGSDNRKWGFSVTNDKSAVHICIASTHYGYISPVWLEIWNVLLWKFVNNKSIFQMSLLSPWSDNRKWGFGAFSVLD